LLVGNSDPRRHGGTAAAGQAQAEARAGPDAGQTQGEFLDLLMPFYPKALAYAQTLAGSLMDGEDLVSDAVLSAYSRFHQLRDRGRFKEWFFAILLNRFRNLSRKTRRHPLTLVAGLPGASGSSTFWEATARASGDPAELGYQLTLVKELLSRLHPQERETLVLLGPAEFTIDEVAAIQECSPRAVIQRAYRARKKLAALLPEGELALLSMPGRRSP
jgi:RNA polymerase sigma factor (sigma-70 family)